MFEAGDRKGRILELDNLRCTPVLGTLLVTVASSNQEDGEQDTKQQYCCHPHDDACNHTGVYAGLGGLRVGCGR